MTIRTNKDKSTAGAPSPGIMYVVAAIALLLGVAWAWMGASRLLVIHEVSGDGQNTAAVITAWDKMAVKGGTSVSLRYTYQVGAQSYQGTDTLSGSAYPEHSAGGKIDIAYSRQHPEHSMLLENAGTSGAVISLVCGLFLIVSSVFIASLSRPTPDTPTPDISEYRITDTDI